MSTLPLLGARVVWGGITVWKSQGVCYLWLSYELCSYANKLNYQIWVVLSSRPHPLTKKKSACQVKFLGLVHLRLVARLEQHSKGVRPCTAGNKKLDGGTTIWHTPLAPIRNDANWSGVPLVYTMSEYKHVRKINELESQKSTTDKFLTQIGRHQVGQYNNNTSVRSIQKSNQVIKFMVLSKYKSQQKKYKVQMRFDWIQRLRCVPSITNTLKQCVRMNKDIMIDWSCCSTGYERVKLAS